MERLLHPRKAQNPIPIWYLSVVKPVESSSHGPFHLGSTASSGRNLQRPVHLLFHTVFYKVRVAQRRDSLKVTTGEVGKEGNTSVPREKVSAVAYTLRDPS